MENKNKRVNWTENTFLKNSNFCEGICFNRKFVIQKLPALEQLYSLYSSCPVSITPKSVNNNTSYSSWGSSKATYYKKSNENTHLSKGRLLK